MTRDRNEVFRTLIGYLRDSFEVPENRIVLEARLFEDLDLDSIDAVDLVVQLQEYSGRKIPVAEFKSVRTVGDVVEQIHALMHS